MCMNADNWVEESSVMLTSTITESNGRYMTKYKNTHSKKMSILK